MFLNKISKEVLEFPNPGKLSSKFGSERMVEESEHFCRKAEHVWNMFGDDGSIMRYLFAQMRKKTYRNPNLKTQIRNLKFTLQKRYIYGREVHSMQHHLNRQVVSRELWPNRPLLQFQLEVLQPHAVVLYYMRSKRPKKQ